MLNALEKKPPQKMSESAKRDGKPETLDQSQLTPTWKSLCRCARQDLVDGSTRKVLDVLYRALDIDHLNIL